MIADTVTSIGDNPFAYCDSLTEITVSSDHLALATIDGVLFDKKENRLVCYPSALEASTYTLPRDTEIIGDNAFAGCNSLTSIMLCDSITDIGSYAFSNCISLTNVTLPNSITSVGDLAFYFCILGLLKISGRFLCKFQ